MNIGGFNIVFLISYFVFGPILTFIHELGHALFALIFTKKEVYILMGEYKLTGYPVKINRLTIYFNKLALVTGFYRTEELPESKFKKLMIILGGPLISVILTIILCILTFSTTDTFVRSVYGGGLMYSVIQTLMTILPMKYVHARYKGFISDGLSALEVIKNKR